MATNFDNLKQETGPSNPTGDPNDQALIVSRKLARGNPQPVVKPTQLAAMLKSAGKKKRGNS